ncbi:hypothetical protein ACI77F_10390 [Pseudomonas tritici]|uniref:hypothetical protein n=1 Tax=Pseudomonas tritici TaxID=2745518 RepID=UPI00387AB166
MTEKFATFGEDGLLKQRLISGVHVIPEGAIKVDSDLWFRLTQETDGIWLLAHTGLIFKKPYPATSPVLPNREEIEAIRLRAYADPLTGSDRYFAEAKRMQFMDEPNWEATRDLGIVRFEQIKAQFPWSPPSIV